MPRPEVRIRSVFGRAELHYVERQADKAADRTDHDDPAAALFTHDRQDGTNDANAAEDIEIEMPADLLQRCFFHGANETFPGTMHDRVEPAFLRGDVGHGRGNRRFIGDVHCDVRPGCIGNVGTACAIHGPVGGRQLRAGGPADAGGVSGDQDDSFQIPILPMAQGPTL